MDHPLVPPLRQFSLGGEFGFRGIWGKWFQCIVGTLDLWQPGRIHRRAERQCSSRGQWGVVRSFLTMHWRRRQSARGVVRNSPGGGFLPVSQRFGGARAATGGGGNQRLEQWQFISPTGSGSSASVSGVQSSGARAERAEACPVPPLAPWRRRRMVRRERPAMRPQEVAGNGQLGSG